MNIDKNRYLLLAIAAGASIGVVIAAQLRRQRKLAFKRDHASDLKTWENEGGNLAPDRAASMQS